MGYKMVPRVISLGKDIDDLGDMHACFYWLSRQDDVDLNKLEKWANLIITFCDKLSQQNKSNQMNLIQMNESIEIQKTKHLTLRHLSYALNEEGIAPNNQQLDNSLKCILKSIDLCSKTNYLIKVYNKRFETKINENDNNQAQNDEIFQSIQNGELDKRDENDTLHQCYHFASNLCQKINKFEQS